MKYSIFILAIVSFLFSSCTKSKTVISKNELIGTWSYNKMSSSFDNFEITNSDKFIWSDKNFSILQKGEHNFDFNEKSNQLKLNKLFTYYTVMKVKDQLVMTVPFLEFDGNGELITTNKIYYKN